MYKGGEKLDNYIYLIINSLGGGGAERVCVTLANELNKRKFKVKIVIFFNRSNSYIDFLDKGIEIINFESKSTLKGYIDLFRFIIKSKPAKVIAFTEVIASICVLARKFIRNDMKILARNVNNITQMKKNSKSFKEKLTFVFSRILYPYVDKFIAQSEGMKDDMIYNWSIEKSKIIVINNPVSDVISESSKRDDYSYKEREEFLFVGRLERQKGIEYLIDAISICKKKGFDVKVNIIGNGSLYNEIEKKIGDRGLNKNIKLLGYKDNVELYYPKSKGLILSSLYEGFPNVMIEAITLGIPVISFDCPSGPSEVIKDGINGFLVKYLDINDLAEKIIKASTYKWNIDAIKRTSNDYKINVILDRYERVINETFKEP